MKINGILAISRRRRQAQAVQSGGITMQVPSVPEFNTQLNKKSDCCSQQSYFQDKRILSGILLILLPGVSY